MTERSRNPEELSAHTKRALLKRLLREKTRRPKQAPLSFGQERIWFLDQLTPASSAYCETVSGRLRADVSPGVLTRALNEVVRRHEILRTTFGEVDGRLVQRIAAMLQLRAPVIDFGALSETTRASELRMTIAAQAERPFDLGRGPLLRLTLVRIHQSEYVVVLTYHHIVGDAWSVGVLLRELFGAYLSFWTGSGHPLPAPSIQYADFARWQRRRLEGAKLKAQLDRLKQRLRDVPVLVLPTDRPRPAVPSLRGAIHTFAFPQRLHWALEAAGRGEGATLFMTTLAAFQLLLNRYTGGEDIVVGSPVAGRDRAELAGLIGFFVNMVSLRTSLRGDPTVRELLRRVRRACLEAYADQDVPFERLVEELRPERTLSQTPLFQVIFAHHRDLMTPPDVPGIGYEPMPIDTRSSKFDLTMHTWCANRDHGLMGSLEYSSDLFDTATIVRMAEHFRLVLQGVATDLDKRISEVSLLNEEQRHQLLFEWSSRRVEHPPSLLLEPFEWQSKRAPDSIAAVFESEHLSYGELNRRADRLAHRLRALGVGPEVHVGVCLSRSLEMVVGLLGIVKSGGVYVPLDPTYPRERLGLMLIDSGAKVVVTRSAVAGLVATEGTQRVLVLLDGDELGLDTESGVHPAPETTPANAAYVIFTSGSTGRPKGVSVTHENVARLFRATAEWFDFGATDTWTLFHSYAFDFSVWELWGALLHGGRLVVVPQWVRRSPAALVELVAAERVTVLNQTPSAFGPFVKVEEKLRPRPRLSLRLVILGGEALEPEGLRAWFDHHGDASPRLVNMYGITETTVHVTHRVVKVADLARRSVSPIGTPIADLRLYVLDRHQQPVPIGVPGELAVGGAGLSRGYLREPKWTAERFIPDPFAPRAGERLYRTGDRSRWLVGGELQYLGRVDQQVKVRGFRIELGEIESALTEHPAVRQAAVMTTTEPGLGIRLVAYLAGSGEGEAPPDGADLRRHLGTRLPEYMIPSLFEWLEALPLTPAGKVDRRALPAPSKRRQSGGYVAPRTSVELELARLWSEVLNVDRVGVEDDFFELGGHSLLAARLSSRVRDAFQVELPLLRLFETPTIAGLAEALTGTAESRPARGFDPEREVVLDPSITFGDFAGPVRSPANVFLTGATGFLGAFLLHELMTTTRAKIHCLVRAANVEEARNRIRATLDSLSLVDDAASSRILPVPGDLSRPYLGLSVADFDELATRVDAIYHSGAVVNALYPYSLHKPTNVLGTHEVLRLSSRHRVKPVHYVSSTGVTGAGADSSSSLVLEETDLDDGRLPLDGYSRSKWVAERMVTEARSRGLPVCIYRPGRITGHSLTGVGNDDDLFSRLLKACVQQGQVPVLDADAMTDIVPVDYVSQALVHLSMREESLGRVFHLVHPHPIEWRRMLEWIVELGYPLRQVPYAEWVEGRNRLARDSEDRVLASLSATALSGSGSSWFHLPRFDCRNTLDALEGTPVLCAPIDERLLTTYFSYWIQNGALPSPESDPQGKRAAERLQGREP